MLESGAAVSLKRSSQESACAEGTQSGDEAWFQTRNVGRQLLKAQKVQSPSPGINLRRERKQMKLQISKVKPGCFPEGITSDVKITGLRTKARRLNP